MKRMLILLTVIVVTVFAWRIADRLSADALGMAVGVAFGVLAGVPAALLVMASGRRRDTRDEDVAGARQPRQMPPQMQGMPYGYLPQPPVIVLAGNGMQPQSMSGYAGGAPRLTHEMMAAPPQSVIDAREFRVIGESDDSLDEW
jgi:hypothetical protein